MASKNINITLALIGKTGNGKSSTANSILERECFVTSDATKASTFLTQARHAVRRNMEIKVVDSPGFMDPDAEMELANVETQIPGIMSVCPEGIHALLLVFKYGNRCTKEEISWVAKAKSIFGDNIIKTHGIIIFTHGENFDMECEKREESNFSTTKFKMWCKNQSGEIENILKECDDRIVLFYNSHLQVYAKKKTMAVEQLLDIAVKMSKKGAYTNVKFQQCVLERERLISEHKLPHLNIKFQRRIDLLIQKISMYIQSDNMTENDLLQLKQLARDLLNDIEMSSNHGSMENLKKCVENIQTAITNLSLKKPVTSQLDNVLKICEAVMNPPMSVVVGATILGCLLIASGVVLTVATGGAGTAVGAIVIESASTAAVIETVKRTAIRLGCTSLATGATAFVSKIIKKFK